MKIQNNKFISRTRFILLMVTMLTINNWCGAQFFQGAAPIDISDKGVIKPNWIVKADFNNDKHLDFAVTNGGKDAVSVYLANSQGSGFLNPVDYGTIMSGISNSGKNPRFFTAAHFQSPDLIDLVTANFESGDISIMLGNKAGTFQNAQCFKVGKAPWSVAVGNFDNNTELDVAVANTGWDTVYNYFCSKTITIWWNYNLKNGNFDNGSTTITVGDAPKSVIAADFDGNGKDDLAVANALSNTVFILMPETKGTTTTFNIKHTIDLGDKSLPFFIVYKEDWKKLFIANYFKDALDVYKNNNGTFSLVNTFRVGMGSYCIDFADFDGDANEDMAVLNMSSDNASILKGKGNGDFEPAVYYRVGNSPHSLVGGNFNGNSKADLLVADFNNHRIIQANDNIFEPKNYATGGGPVFMASASLNEKGLNPDKFLDLVTVNELGNSVSVLLGDGNGGFTYDIADINVGNTPKGLAIGNFDNDGKDDDVAVVNYGDKTVMILLNTNDNGHLFAGNTIKLNENPTSITTVDFNNNGNKQDLAIVAFPHLYIWDVKKNKGIDTFDLVSTAKGIKDKHSSIVAFDFGNTSGLAIADCEKLTVLKIKNKILSKFDEKNLRTDTTTKPWFVVNGDFDGDKKADDLAVADSTGNQIYISLYDKKKDNFSSPIPVNVGKYPCFIGVTDFDFDSKADLAVINGGSQNVSLLRGNGMGKFTLVNSLETSRKPSSLVIGDFNKKGGPDIAVTYKQCFELLKRKNDCNNSFFNITCSGTIGFVTVYNQ